MQSLLLMCFITLSLILGGQGNAVKKNQKGDASEEEKKGPVSQSPGKSSQGTKTLKSEGLGSSKASGVLILRGLEIDRSTILSVSMHIRDKAGGIRAIDLSDNQIDEVCAWTLSESFSYHPQINALSFYNNKLCDQGAEFIGALRHLKILDLSRNKIGNKGAVALSKITELLVLNLLGNEIGFEGFQALALSLGSSHEKKRTVNLRKNPLYKKEEREIYKAFISQHDISNVLFDTDESQEKAELKLEKVSNVNISATSSVEQKLPSSPKDSKLKRLPQPETPLQQEKLPSLSSTPTTSASVYSERIRRLKEELGANKIEAVGDLIALYKEAGPKLKEVISEDEIQDLHDLAGAVFTAFSKKQIKSNVVLPSEEAFYKALKEVFS